MSTVASIAAPAGTPYHLADLDVDVLRRLAESQGCDAAGAILERAIRTSPPHAAFIQQVDSISANEVPKTTFESIAIVPGALFREYPATGADGRRFIDVVQTLGIPCRTIPIKSLGSLDENARIITDWLADHPAEPLMLVSFSKGGADIKTALLNVRNHAAFRHVHTWLSVGGILHGTPLVAWLRAHWVRHFLVRQLLRVRGANPRNLLQLAHGPDTPLDMPTVLPPWLRLIHLVAFPTAADLSMPLACRAFRRVAPFGPNDAGGLLLGDLCRFPGLIYPMTRADHYMRTDAFAPLLTRLLAVSRNLAAGPRGHLIGPAAMSPSAR